MIAGGPVAVTAALSTGLKPSMLDGKADKAFSFIVQHQMEHGTVPSQSDISSLFGEVVVATDLAPAFVFQELLQRALFRRVAEGVDGVITKLKGNDPNAALSLMRECIESASTVVKKGKAPTSLFELGADVLQEQALIKSGAIGIPTPWESINKMCMGLWPGTNTWLMARPGTGKTWLEIIIAEHAWKLRLQDDSKKFRQLVISAEMLKVQIAERFFGVRSKLPYGAVVSATLGNFAEKKFETVIQDHQHHDGIWILDGSDDLSPARIQEAIEELDIDLLVVDAAYKVQWMAKPKDRFENLYRGAETLSNWTKRDWKNGKKIAALVSSQMNRQGADKGGASKQTVAALTDNIMWEADNVFGVEQTADMKADKRLALHAVKVRRMAELKPRTMIRWDMVDMEFGEIQVGQGQDDTAKKPAKKFNDAGWKDKILAEDGDAGF